MDTWGWLQKHVNEYANKWNQQRDREAKPLNISIPATFAPKTTNYPDGNCLVEEEQEYPFVAVHKILACSKVRLQPMPLSAPKTTPKSGATYHVEAELNTVGIFHLLNVGQVNPSFS